MKYIPNMVVWGRPVARTLKPGVGQCYRMFSLEGKTLEVAE